jgi:hypothetical protein
MKREKAMSQSGPVRIVGFVDGLGYLHCTSCIDIDIDGDHSPDPVYSDQSAHVGESCDFCGDTVS